MVWYTTVQTMLPRWMDLSYSYAAGLHVTATTN